MNRAAFFDAIRTSLFGHLSISQVNGINELFAAWETYGTGIIPHLAYILASVKHETGDLMIPVRETFAHSDEEARKRVAKRPYGKVGKHGFVPYGRGRIQTTWDSNYEKVEKRFGIACTKNPDLLLDGPLDAHVAVTGHIEGIWTGKALADYITDAHADYVNARRIVNGHDKAELIAGYAVKFEAALRAA